MRKLFVATIICLALALCACSLPASATNLPSEATADYAGGEWSCRVLAYAHPAGLPSTVVELMCTDGESLQRRGSGTHHGCPGDFTYTLYPWWTRTVSPAPPPTAFRIVAYDGASLTVEIDGQTVVMSRTQAIPSPAPYTCQAPTPLPVATQHIPRLCRQFGLYCG